LVDLEALPEKAGQRKGSDIQTRSHVTPRSQLLEGDAAALFT
jgi:hypothetical protein